MGEELLLQIDICYNNLDLASGTTPPPQGKSAGSGDGQTRRLQDGSAAAVGTTLGSAVGSKLGLEIHARCPPSLGESSKSKSAKSKSQNDYVSIDVLINTENYGKDCDANVTQVTAIYANKDGEYETQDGIIQSRTPISDGVQILRIDFTKEKYKIYAKKDVTLLQIIAVKDGGGDDPLQREKSTIFDYSVC